MRGRRSRFFLFVVLFAKAVADEVGVSWLWQQLDDALRAKGRLRLLLYKEQLALFG
jgi:hypothetical protein